MPTKESWIDRRWRPAMGWSYIGICVFDFVIAPIINYIYFFKTGGDFQSWKPLTMSDGGLFHMAMGAVLGVTAWSRGQEKLTRYKSNDRYSDEMGENPAAIFESEQQSSRPVRRKDY